MLLVPLYDDEIVHIMIGLDILMEKLAKREKPIEEIRETKKKLYKIWLNSQELK